MTDTPSVENNNNSGEAETENTAHASRNQDNPSERKHCGQNCKCGHKVDSTPTAQQSSKKEIGILLAAAAAALAVGLLVGTGSCALTVARLHNTQQTPTTSEHPYHHKGQRAQQLNPADGNNTPNQATPSTPDIPNINPIQPGLQPQQAPNPPAAPSKPQMAPGN
jgi:hypothetical protein